MKHFATFGSLAMLRGLCPECNRYSLILDGKHLCCGHKTDDSEPVGFVSICEGRAPRKIPKREDRINILLDQGFKCFYCGEELVKIHWDHTVPYSFANQNKFFVASCPLCNLLKGSKMFDTKEEAIIYVQEKRRQREQNLQKRKMW